MPNYSFNHIHHETKNVEETVAWYQDVFNATSDEPFQRGGANWVFVYIDKIQITVTDRDFTDMKLGRYQKTLYLGPRTRPILYKIGKTRKNK